MVVSIAYISCPSQMASPNTGLLRRLFFVTLGSRGRDACPTMIFIQRGVYAGRLPFVLDDRLPVSISSRNFG
jgi:hypothetical protein